MVQHSGRKNRDVIQKFAICKILTEYVVLVGRVA